MNSKLVILSVPIMRLARVTLSPDLISSFTEKAEVLIVSPFAREAGFRRSYENDKVDFLYWNEDDVSSFKKRLLKIPDLVRRFGYIRKNQQFGLAYYLKNMYVQFKPDEQDIKLNFLLRLCLFAMSHIGRSALAWKKLESMLGKSWYQFPELDDFVSKFDEVTLVQSMNWGLQDRALARLSKSHWRKVLIPYTTDQIFFNGYFINTFDAVCVQGQFEYNAAIENQRVPKKKVYRLGSVWFKHIAALNAEMTKQNSDPKPDFDYIIYAGVDSAYFPFSTEVQSVDVLSEYIHKQLPGLKLVYRPVVSEPKTKEQLIKKYENSKVVMLDWPSPASIGLGKYQNVDMASDLKAYIGLLRHCKLFIMSKATSMLLDAAYVARCGIISNLIDTHGVLRKRNYHHLDQLMEAQFGSSVVIVKSFEALKQKVAYFLTDPREGQRQSAKAIDNWDYEDVDFKKTLFSSCQLD